MRNTLFIIFLYDEDTAKTEMGLRKVRTAFQGFPEFRDRVRNLPLPLEDVTEVVVGLGVPRVNLQRSTECFFGLLGSAPVQAHYAVIEIGFSSVRIKAHRSAVMLFRLRYLAELPVNVNEPDMGFGDLRIDPQRLLVGIRGVLSFPAPPSPSPIFR